jgi:hypothetical protein
LAAPFLFRGKNVRDLKTNFDLTGYLPDHRDQRSVTLFCIGMPKPILARKAEPVQPVARYVYSNNGCLSYHVTLSSLCLAVPKTGRRQLFETVKRGGISLLKDVVMPQGV